MIAWAKPVPPVLPVKKVNGAEVVGSIPALATAASTFVTTFATLTFATPTVLMSAAVIVACSSVLEIKVVDLTLPLNFTTEAGTKFAPLTTTVKSPPPFTAEPGVSTLMVGGGKAAVRVRLPEEPPAGAGLNTATFARPTDPMSLAEIAA